MWEKRNTWILKGKATSAVISLCIVMKCQLCSGPRRIKVLRRSRSREASINSVRFDYLLIYSRWSKTTIGLEEFLNQNVHIQLEIRVLHCAPQPTHVKHPFKLCASSSFYYVLHCQIGKKMPMMMMMMMMSGTSVVYHLNMMYVWNCFVSDLLKNFHRNSMHVG